MLGLADVGEHRPKSTHKGKQNHRFSQHGSDASSQKNGSGSLKFRSKYMTSDEIESILRMQLAVTHCNDPYDDDYYHQACLAKKSGAKLKHSFCPIQIKELPPRARANTESHGFLQVDAEGFHSWLFAGLTLFLKLICQILLLVVALSEIFQRSPLNRSLCLQPDSQLRMVYVFFLM